jgi:hypothetical protein
MAPVPDPREDAPREDPLALDPYSPTFPEWKDPDPMALDPYSPIPSRQAPDDSD